MKDDLIERLRDFGDNAEFEPHMYHVAADRIEAQAAEIARLREQLAEAQQAEKDGAYHVLIEIPTI